MRRNGGLDKKKRPEERRGNVYLCGERAKLDAEVFSVRKRSFLQWAGDFMAGKGFYIALFLCITAVGMSGYYVFSNMSVQRPETEVWGRAEVEDIEEPAYMPEAEPPELAPSPSPVPVLLETVEQRSRSKESKMRHKKASLMPTPVSATLNT